MRVELGDDWRGTTDDLKGLLGLDQHHYFRLVGPAVDDQVIKLFEAKEGLRLLQIFTSRVTPAAADSLKAASTKGKSFTSAIVRCWAFKATRRPTVCE